MTLGQMRNFDSGVKGVGPRLRLPASHILPEDHLRALVGSLLIYRVHDPLLRSPLAEL